MLSKDTEFRLKWI